MSYFASTFSFNGIFYSVPIWDTDYHIIIIRGTPRSAVSIFLLDLLKDLKMHDIPVRAYLSCIYPDTPDILIIPSLKRVILNANNLTTLSNKLKKKSKIRELNLNRFCNNKLLENYQKTIEKLKEKIYFHQQQGFQYLKQLKTQHIQTGQVTKEMLLLFQSIFPVTAENKGKPQKVLASSITSSGWISNIQYLTTSLKRRYILHGSPTFLKTFFQLAESRAYNLNMKCQLIINPLNPEQIDGILFPEEEQVILTQNKHHSILLLPHDISLYFNNENNSEVNNHFERNLNLAIKSFIKAHSYREELDEYYWYSLNLDQFLSERQRVMHQLLALCDGQELWEYFM
ncbi:hypothetical protein BBF96_14845 [Anoxybacter fermentans]|uniref:Uncharacterized protein n=1 Tax=Anoxybacter fermentans TaxID=1323375 RepID=A0A3Q9HUB1_9FIRM|nr:hypothetical protein [Anoxybacter fermentans]AZR74552.1 hypothetical protein BBF96_14845 [Anoxybacter fermentans]